MTLFYAPAFAPPGTGQRPVVPGDRVQARVRGSLIAFSWQSMQIGDTVYVGNVAASQLLMYMDITTSIATGSMTVRPFTYRRDGVTRLNLANALTITGVTAWNRFSTNGAGAIMEGQPLYLEIGGAAAPASGSAILAYQFLDQ